MRIMFNGTDIEEIVSIELIPAWKMGKSTQDIPDYLGVTIISADSPDTEITGRYILDGTDETYQAAMDNYSSIAEQLLVKGYCRDSEFENFEWD